MIVYGTPEELAVWVDPDTEPAPPVPLASVLLRSATQTVLDYTAAAVYATDSDGKATNPKVLDALLSATLTQATALHLANIDPRRGTGGVKRRVASKSLNGASVTYLADSRSDSYDTDLAAGALVYDAWVILRNAGLITSRVQTRDRGGVALSGIPYDPTTGEMIP